MDGQEYLNQISAQTRPVKKSGMGKIFSSKLFVVGMIGILLFIVIMIIGAVLSGGKGGGKTAMYELKLHVDNTSEVIQKYQPNVKSSDLRSSSASLYSILSNTSRDLTNYLTEKYKFKEKDIDPIGFGRFIKSEDRKFNYQKWRDDYYKNLTVKVDVHVDIDEVVIVE